ncbi:E3 ubiquitin-protein ligase RBBP6-like [Falco naumanni]|uniref:E3 ubiquitin-protein ligase RBBP6-like n=1 Tax=Falco naumanni TaxID=148594 RepID=UPI001ADE806A|nr:E3 ubiquitin-protein ligase RBBP6-like [Falco naumanni]
MGSTNQMMRSTVQMAIKKSSKFLKIQTDNLAEANATKEDKVQAMMVQSCCEYNPVKEVYMKDPWDPPPPSNICLRCGKPGHDRKNCPTKWGKNVESLPRIKRSTGIPTSFMMEVKDPNTKGAMLTKARKNAIPTINVEAYARGKKEKPPFLPEEPSFSSSSDDPIPEELLRPICKDAMTDAAVIPCCFCNGMQPMAQHLHVTYKKATP